MRVTGSLFVINLPHFIIKTISKVMRTEKDARQEYIEKNFIKQDSRRKQIISELRNFNKEGINVSSIEGKLLKVLAQMIKAHKIVEIGTLFGYSTSWFLDALTNNEDKIWSFEFSKEHYEKAVSLLKTDIENNRLKIILGNAIEELPKIEKEGPFDLIFIDANKAGYMDYFKWADENLRSGGLIIADNTFLFGTVYQESVPENNKKAWQVMRKLNQTLGQNNHYESIMIPTAEGMTIALKK